MEIIKLKSHSKGMKLKLKTDIDVKKMPSDMHIYFSETVVKKDTMASNIQFKHIQNLIKH